MRTGLMAALGRQEDTPALESIAFQETSFFKELVLAFEELKTSKVAGAELSDEPAAIRVVDLIKAYTGLKIELSIGNNQPCVEIPMVNKNNVLLNNFIRNFVNSKDGLKMIKNADTVVRGEVNLLKAKVSGVFSEFETTMHLPSEMFKTNKFSPEEIASVAMHEIGHIFVYYEFITRTVTTNQVLAGLSRGLDESDAIESREAILMSAKDALKLKDLDEKEMAKVKNHRIIETVIITEVAKESVSELGANVCDFSSWEYLADQFAARQGCGRYLVTALDKIYRAGNNISFRSTTGYIAMEAMKLLLVVISPVLALIFIAMDGQGDGTYDVPGARFKRIRSQIVEQMKDRELDKATYQRLQEDLLEIDSVLGKVDDRRQFFGVVWDLLSSDARKARAQIQLQQELEALAANDLFVKAAEFRNA